MRTLRIALQILFLFFPILVQSENLVGDLDRDCGDRFEVGEKCKFKITELRPTQGAVGFEEVRRKTAELAKMSSSEAEEYRKKKRIPVVVGPGQKLYMIDHHHSALALLNHGFDSGYIEVIGDLSDSKSNEEFWQKMIAKNWCYPFDGTGQAIAPEKIPRSLRGLSNDPYRALSGIVRDLGGFEKSGVPFEEFIWARRFQKLTLLPISQTLSNQPQKLSENDYNQAAYQAVALINWKFWADSTVCEQQLRRLIEQLP